VDTEDDPDHPGEQRLKFSSVEGFVPPSAVELATTASDAEGGDSTPPSE